jgi:hypothetical protein
MVGSAAVELDGSLVFFDPLLPPDEDGFWRWADARVSDREVSVLTTIEFHSRDRDRVTSRYGADSTPPEGVTAEALPGAGEIVFWVEPQAALVFGDRILGDDQGGLRLCPESWLRNFDVGLHDLRELIRPLLVLPVERVIVSHGEPVLGDGREALARAIA